MRRIMRDGVIRRNGQISFSIMYLYSRIVEKSLE